MLLQFQLARSWNCLSKTLSNRSLCFSSLPQVGDKWSTDCPREWAAVFTFLYCPGLEAINWRAEQAIRPLVVTRKIC
jgi:hypothetical protein